LDWVEEWKEDEQVMQFVWIAKNLAKKENQKIGQELKRYL
jgi:hypothetical protein